MKITLDTNVLIRAHGNGRHTARPLLELILERHELVLSQSLLYEVEEVLSYPEVRRLSRLSDSQAEAFVNFLSRSCRLVDLGKPRPFALHDLDDWMIVRTALAGEVDVLCTMDNDLRHESIRPEFEQKGIVVMNDRELLNWLQRI